MLRRVVRNRPPQHSCKRKRADLALKNRHLSSAWSFGFEIGPQSGRIATLKSANGKSQIRPRGLTRIISRQSNGARQAWRMQGRTLKEKLKMFYARKSR